MSELRDIRISGSGSICGGEYNSVKISGSGNVKGDVICKEFSASGAANINGNVRAEVLKVSGAANLNGDIDSHEIRISGSAKISGNVSGRETRISGGVRINENLNGDKIKISGGVSIGGDFEGEEIIISGGIKVKGLINAGTLDIKLNGNSNAREIGGENITIKKSENSGGGLLSKLFMSMKLKDYHFKCETIEGDTIYLENTICNVVRGKNIIIGEGCQIERIEYTNTIDRNDDGEVKDIVKL